MGAYYSEDRKKYVLHTDAVSFAEEVFLSRKGAGITYRTLSDPKQYRIGVLRGGAPNKDLTNAGIFIEEVSNYEMNLRKMIKGRLDLVLGGKMMWQHMIKTKFPQLKKKIEIVKPSLSTFQLLVIMSKTNPKHKSIVKDFNRGLKQIKTSGEYDRILQKHGFE